MRMKFSCSFIISEESQNIFWAGLLTARQNAFKINLYANEIFLQFCHFGGILKHILRGVAYSKTKYF